MGVEAGVWQVWLMTGVWTGVLALEPVAPVEKDVFVNGQVLQGYDARTHALVLDEDEVYGPEAVPFPDYIVDDTQPDIIYRRPIDWERVNYQENGYKEAPGNKAKEEYVFNDIQAPPKPTSKRILVVALQTHKTPTPGDDYTGDVYGHDAQLQNQRLSQAARHTRDVRIAGGVQSPLLGKIAIFNVTIPVHPNDTTTTTPSPLSN